MHHRQRPPGPRATAIAGRTRHLQPRARRAGEHEAPGDGQSGDHHETDHDRPQESPSAPFQGHGGTAGIQEVSLFGSPVQITTSSRARGSGSTRLQALRPVSVFRGMGQTFALFVVDVEGRRFIRRVMHADLGLAAAIADDSADVRASGLIYDSPFALGRIQGTANWTKVP